MTLNAWVIIHYAVTFQRDSTSCIDDLRELIGRYKHFYNILISVASRAGGARPKLLIGHNFKGLKNMCW